MPLKRFEHKIDVRMLMRTGTVNTMMSVCIRTVCSRTLLFLAIFYRVASSSDAQADLDLYWPHTGIRAISFLKWSN